MRITKRQLRRIIKEVSRSQVRMETGSEIAAGELLKHAMDQYAANRDAKEGMGVKQLKGEMEAILSEWVNEVTTPEGYLDTSIFSDLEPGAKFEPNR